MSETIRQTNPNELNEIYAKLNAQEVEQFYAGYLWWKLHRRSVVLQEQREALQREIAANAELMEMVHPPAIALATMARLQASGVSDSDLLDRMLERGEDWLDGTMQRLDYCEQLDFIIDDYTQWCRNALEGAYDWIDSMREGGNTSSIVAPTDDPSIEATEELLLQKLVSEEEEASTPEEHATLIEQSPDVVETPPSIEETMPESQKEQSPQLSQASQSVEVSSTSDSPDEEPIIQEHIEPESQPVETSHASDSIVEATPASDELSPTFDHERSVEDEDSEASTGETAESEQLISQVYKEFDPAPEELPSVERDDAQVPLQEHSKDILTDESPVYWEEPLPYRMYPPDKQPDIGIDGLEHAEESIPAVTLERRRNLLQRLAAKIWRK